MNSILDVLKKASDEIVLQSHPVAVPELASMFPPGVPPLLYMATLTALEKDKADEQYNEFLKRNQLSDKDSRTLYRSFCVAFCLADKDNNRQAVSNSQIDSAVESVAKLGNVIIRRAFNVANGANGFFGVDSELKKNSEDPPKNQKSDGGNGESHSHSDTQADPLG